MKKEEFEKLSEIKKSEDLITVKDLVNKQDRTLLYGYTYLYYASWNLDWI